jgi:transglutaminase-like putative cysteine protease
MVMTTMAPAPLGWRLRIEHDTGFRYAGKVRASYNEARLTPLTLPGQTTLEARIEVRPAATQSRYWDYWGTQVTVFDLHEPHDLLQVTSTSVVETSPAPPLPSPADWAEIADRGEPWYELTVPTRLTAVDESLAAQALELASGRDPLSAALAVTGWVRDTVAYVRGATGVRTSAHDAYAQRAGVCQDLAHLSVGMLRAVGLPARYVSGYIHPSTHAEIGVTGDGQSHAWVEVWVGSWVAWDPTNGAAPSERHVTVARGRDYDDVPPLKGVYRGAPSTSVGVGVQVTRLA